MIYYNNRSYEEYFNHVVFNCFWRQSDFNNTAQLSIIDDRLKETRLQCLEFFKQVSQEVKTNEETADKFVSLITTTLLDSIQHQLLAEFETQVYNAESEIRKKDIQAEATQRFQNAVDTETIVQHIVAPIEQEKQIFRERFMSRQRSISIKMCKKFSEKAQKVLNNANEFIL